ncbi:hypothetical protein TVAG_056890 [Trichomonas vaginalis G3]|uniref:Bromo domain-containing protein n=1 Tax=Trichomonas vaginalis (strain ATCC PRA-98 / G3) TaxID=412133 RepID=A2EK97_TRIV3|nr:acetylation-dependent protein binding [Trichomonas vaginalis G3]EAY06895.1 hypothetical protein TVAG_056890 [Trichomonas vaginalis G3]KAI5513944.1 acetylation-dependent protein binding [Trichomonas vaginalis G3]|eukprot:XP_001319118.1 hypothetical protein [Trichomonas vaginalis G3]
MNEYLQGRILRIVESLIEWSVCSQFTSAPATTDGLAMNMFIVPEQKFDLNSIKTKCENKEYKTLEEYRDDVNKVLATGLEKKNKDNFMYIMAQEAYLWFNNKINTLPRNQEQEWRDKIAKQVAKINELLQYNPLNPPPTQKQIKDTFSKLPL